MQGAFNINKNFINILCMESFLLLIIFLMFSRLLYRHFFIMRYEILILHNDSSDDQCILTVRLKIVCTHTRCVHSFVVHICI